MKLNLRYYLFNFYKNQPVEQWQLVLRIVVALFGGYLLTLTSSMLLSQILDMLGMERINATLTAMLLSFAIYTAIIIWFFAIASVKKVWFNLVIALVVTSILVWLLSVS